MRCLSAGVTRAYSERLAHRLAELLLVELRELDPGHGRLLLGHAEVAGDPRCRAGMVPGDHHDPDPCAAGLGDGDCRLRARWVADSDHAAVDEVLLEGFVDLGWGGVL